MSNTIRAINSPVRRSRINVLPLNKQGSAGVHDADGECYLTTYRTVAWVRILHRDDKRTPNGYGIMNDVPIKIAIIGTGLIGPRHAQSVARCNNASLLCLIDPRPEAQTVADAFNVPLFRDIKHMLSGGDHTPDAAIVCTPNHTHVDVGKELLQAGIHVVVEKPIATSIDSGRDLIQTARDCGKQLLAGHHRRFNPYIEAAKIALEEGVVGSVVAISGLWTLYKPPSYFEAPTEWRAKAGVGGPILINLIHEVS